MTDYVKQNYYHLISIKSRMINIESELRTAITDTRGTGTDKDLQTVLESQVAATDKFASLIQDKAVLSNVGEQQ